MKIQRLSAERIEPFVPDLAEILTKTVEADGAVGFVLPHTDAESAQFWRNSITPAVQNGERLFVVAIEDGRAVGTGQLIIGMPNNQPHRAEISKLMVHPDFRKKGIARKIMHELHNLAAAFERTLITLDTRTGEAAEPFYASLGYETAGVIPHFAKNAVGDEFHATTYMYKHLT